MSVSADRNQRLLMIGLPFIFTTFIIRFPAGLIVYWITTNLWTVGQQYAVRRHAWARSRRPSCRVSPARRRAPPPRSPRGKDAPSPRARAGEMPAAEPAATRRARKKKRSGRRR